MNRRMLLKLFLGTAATAACFRPGSATADTPPVTVWKAASCGCCAKWVAHMRKAGFTVRVEEMDDVTPVKDSKGVPKALRSCHTAVAGSYVIEGHVPPEAVIRLLAEHPVAGGLAVPGMPPSAPGMDIGAQRYQVVIFGSGFGDGQIYATYN